MASEDGPDVGFTGARFGGGGRRRDRRGGPTSGADDDTVSMATVRVESERLAVTADPAEPVVGLTGARFGGSSRRRRRETPPTDAVTPQTPPDGDTGAAPDPEPVVWRDQPADPDPLASSSVRPYVLTRGRTRSTFELAIEALVSVVPAALDGQTPHPDIVELCREPRSVAEIAALRGVPLGVARVLLGDLAAAGAVVVHRTVDAGGPDVALMERVLSGLRRL